MFESDNENGETQDGLPDDIVNDNGAAETPMMNIIEIDDDFSTGTVDNGILLVQSKSTERKRTHKTNSWNESDVESDRPRAQKIVSRRRS